MGDVIYTPAFDERRAAEDAARQRIQRRRSVVTTTLDGTAVVGEIAPNLAAPSEYVAPDHDCA